MTCMKYLQKTQMFAILLNSLTDQWKQQLLLWVRRGRPVNVRGEVILGYVECSQIIRVDQQRSDK